MFQKDVSNCRSNSKIKIKNWDWYSKQLVADRINKIAKWQINWFLTGIFEQEWIWKIFEIRTLVAIETAGKDLKSAIRWEEISRKRTGSDKGVLAEVSLT